MAQDQILQDQRPELASTKDIILSFLKKNLVIIGMIVFGIILLFPIAIFVFLSDNPPQEVPQTGGTSKEKTFAPTAPHRTDQLIVKLKDSYTKEELERLQKKLDELGVVSQEKLLQSEEPPLKNYYILKFKEGVDIKKAGQELINLPELEEVEPNYHTFIQEMPIDPNYGQLWGLDRISMPQAWDLEKGSNSIKIAVIDSGINYNHEDFFGRVIIKGSDFSTGNCCRGSVCDRPKLRDSDPLDDNGHGTHVAGTIGAVTNNDKGVSGINWDVTLMAVKVMSRAGCSSDANDVLDGLEYAINNDAKVINMSLGGDYACTSVYQNLINSALSRGIIVVAAAGNGGSDRIGDDVSGYSPASCEGVIAVASTNSSDSRAPSSNWGRRIDIAAPGVGIYSTWLADSYGLASGTSMAAPHVTGVVGLLLAANPALSRDQIHSCLVNGADPITPDRYIESRLNAYGALTYCANISSGPITITPIPPSAGPSPALTLTPTQPGQLPSSINGSIFIDINGNGTQDSDEAGFAGAQITLEGPVNKQIVSDSQGNFSFLDLNEGPYAINMNVGSQRACSSSGNLPRNTQITLTPCPIPASGPGSSPIIVQPTILPTPTLEPSPTPVKTYTCRERSDAEPAKVGAIKIGDLICEPN